MGVENKSASGVTLPVTLPIELGGSGSSGVTLPLTLPISFSSSGGSKGVTLPLTLPISFGKNEERKRITMPTTETCVYVNEAKRIKLSITEKALAKCIEVPVTEKGWVFYGLIIEENIVKEMQSQLLLMEDVKARILVDYEMINGTDVKVHWYGDRVDKVEIYMKMSLEEEYEKKGTYLWEQTSAIVTLGAGEFDLMVKGVNETGLSEKFTLGEPTFIEVDYNIEVPINEKIIDVPIEYTRTYKVEINY